jgi:diguanylate cyclase (GGDEF)-like protein
LDRQQPAHRDPNARLRRHAGYSIATFAGRLLPHAAYGLCALACVLSVALASPLAARLAVALGWLGLFGMRAAFLELDRRSRLGLGRSALQLRLQRKAEILKAIETNIPAMVYQRTASSGGGWEYPFVSGCSNEILGRPPQEVMGPEGFDPAIFCEGEYARVVAAHAAAIESGGGAWCGEFRVLARNGEMKWIRASVQVDVEDGREKSSIGVLLDVTSEKRAHGRAQDAQDRDMLTEVYSRDYFERAVASAIERFSAQKRLFAIVIFDIDDLCELNDAFGVDVGDRLLRLVADAALDSVPEAEVVARLGGDKFGILAEVADVEAAPALAERVVKSLGRRYRVGTSEVEVTVSAGCALPTGYRTRATDLIHDAGSALERARSEGCGMSRLYTDEMTVESVMRVTIKEALREALGREEFTLVYQPKIDLASGRVSGCEALIRWRDPVLGVQSPAQFIPIAERSGLIVPIGDWVFREACRQYVAWQQAGVGSVPISVNVSPVQFARSDVHKAIAGAMMKTGAPRGAIDIEITESLLVDCSDHLIGELEQIRKLGSEISLDDFGTGFSSISYLKRLPLSLLKIDQSFARVALTSSIDAAIVRSIIYLAEELGLRVIAEGAETAEQVEYLRAAGCQEIQGYYFSKPLPADEFAEYLRLHGTAKHRRLRLAPAHVKGSAKGA